MQYFGVPKCPYCKKRVNFIRTWSLRRQGEYKCPRCQGISNIYLSPLTHVFAVIAIFVAGILYFFHSFILADLSISTVGEVIIPFVAFYVLSMFMVYLDKPVLKQKNKKRIGGSQPKAKPARSVKMATDSFEEKHDIPDLQGGNTEHGSPQRRQPAHAGAYTGAHTGAMRQPPQGSSMQDRETESRELHSRELQQAGQPQRRAPRKPAPVSQDDRYSIDPDRYTQEGRYQEKEQLPAAQKSIEVTMPIAPRKPKAEDSRVIEKIDIGDDFFQKYTDQKYVRERMSEDDKRDSES